MKYHLIKSMIGEYQAITACGKKINTIRQWGFNKIGFMAHFAYDLRCQKCLKTIEKEN